VRERESICVVVCACVLAWHGIVWNSANAQQMASQHAGVHEKVCACAYMSGKGEYSQNVMIIILRSRRKCTKPKDDTQIHGRL